MSKGKYPNELVSSWDHVFVHLFVHSKLDNILSHALTPHFNLLVFLISICVHVYMYVCLKWSHGLSSQIFKIAAEKLKATVDFPIAQFYSILLKGIDSKIKKMMDLLFCFLN